MSMSVFEINDRIVPILRRERANNGPPAPVDDLQDALNERKRLLAQTVRTSALQEAEANLGADKEEASVREAKATTARLQEEMKQLSLQEQFKQMTEAATAGQSGVLTQILALFHEDRQAASAQLEQTRTTLMEFLHGQISDLRQQLMERAVGPSPNGHQPPSLVAQMAELKQVYEGLQALFPKPGPTELVRTGQSLDELAKLHQIQEGHELKQQQIAEAHEERMIRLNMERKRWEREDEREERRVGEDERRGRSLSEALTKSLPFAQRLVGDLGSRLFAGGGGGGAPSVADASLSGSAPAAAGPPPAGTRFAPCSSCKVLIPFPPGVSPVACPACGILHSLEEGPEAPPFSGEGEGEQEPVHAY